MHSLFGSEIEFVRVMRSFKRLRVIEFFVVQKEPKAIPKLVTAIMRGSRNKMVRLACTFMVGVAAVLNSTAFRVDHLRPVRSLLEMQTSVGLAHVSEMRRLAKSLQAKGLQAKGLQARSL
jgi:hypothetical protein